MDIRSWQEMLDEFEDVIIACTLTDDELSKKFNTDFGSNLGKPFTAWSELWVYFPIVYDGAQWIGRAPRNPCDIATEHQGAW